MPRTSVRNTIPTDGSGNRRAEEEEYAHNEHTDPHREHEAERMRTPGTHGGKFNSRKC